MIYLSRLETFLVSCQPFTSTAASLLPPAAALDPAYPGFNIEDLLDTHLAPTDALFVDVIHTDGGLNGVPYSTGHADFYPNCGRRVQPGCPLVSVPLSDSGQDSGQDQDELHARILGCRMWSQVNWLQHFTVTEEGSFGSACARAYGRSRDTSNVKDLSENQVSNVGRGLKK